MTGCAVTASPVGKNHAGARARALVSLSVVVPTNVRRRSWPYVGQSMEPKVARPVACAGSDGDVPSSVIAHAPASAAAPFAITASCYGTPRRGVGHVCVRGLQLVTLTGKL